MLNVKIRDSIPDDLGDMIRTGMRESDFIEAFLASGNDPDEALYESFSKSSIRKTVLLDGVVVALFGTCPPTLLSTVACVWFIATDIVEAFPKSFSKISRDAVLDMASQYELLYNFADSNNKRSIRWLRWMGFDVSEQPVPYGAFRYPFHPFTMKGGAPCV